MKKIGSKFICEDLDKNSKNTIYLLGVNYGGLMSCRKITNIIGMSKVILNIDDNMHYVTILIL